MSDYSSSINIEELIEKHARYKDGKRYLNSFNIDEGSIVIYKDTRIYDDKENDTNLFYEAPFYNGDPTDGYNEKFTWAFISKNKGKKIKLLTVGKVTKLEYVTLYPDIIEWKGKKCIKLDRSCCIHQSPRRELYYSNYNNYSGYCYDCGDPCEGYKRCYSCNMNY